MERLIEADLQRLKTETLTAFRLAQAAVDTAVRSVFERDPALADAVISGDAAIDAMECSLDAEVLRILALHQPVAGDLRAIVGCMRCSGDIERIGDQAVNISLRLKKLASARANIRCPMLDKINEMAREDGTMLSEVMQAFLKNDESVIFSTRTRRKTVHKARDEAVDAVLRDNKPVSAADITTGELFLALWILRHLSRISDHVLNLAEKVVFIATGVSPLTLKKKNQQANSDARLKSLGV